MLLLAKWKDMSAPLVKSAEIDNGSYFDEVLSIIGLGTGVTTGDERLVQYSLPAAFMLALLVAYRARVRIRQSRRQ